MDDPECPVHAIHSSKHWVERDSLRQWAIKEQALVRSLSSGERENLRNSFAVDEAAELSRLLERAQHLQEYILRKRAHLSPQRLLYPELLRQVFIELANEQKDEFTFPFAFKNPPAVFRVCKRWRQIALATGELFSRLDITQKSAESLEYLPYFTSMMQRWLSLLVNITPTLPEMKSLNCEMESLSQIGNFRSNRMSSDNLQILSIDINLEDPSIRPTRAGPLKLPHLQDIHVKVYGIDDLAMLQHEFETPASTAWSLELCLDGEPFKNEHASVLNSFTGTITGLMIDAATMVEFHKWEGQELDSPTRLRLPNLQSCQIQTSADDFFGCPCFLSECPQLTRLFLDENDVASRGRKCTTVLKSVTSLRLGMWRYSTAEDAAYHLLSIFPNLHDLHWEVTTKKPRVFTQYLQTLKKESCCPRLTTLSITNGTMDRFDLLNLLSLRSQLLGEAGNFLITLRDCPNLPNVEMMDSAGLRAKIPDHIW